MESVALLVPLACQVRVRNGSLAMLSSLDGVPCFLVDPHLMCSILSLFQLSQVMVCCLKLNPGFVFQG